MATSYRTLADAGRGEGGISRQHVYQILKRYGLKSPGWRNPNRELYSTIRWYFSCAAYQVIREGHERRTEERILATMCRAWVAAVDERESTDPTGD